MRHADIEEIEMRFPQPPITGIPLWLTVERQGNGSWRLSCQRCVQDRVVPNLGHCRAQEFIATHTKCGNACHE